MKTTITLLVLIVLFFLIKRYLFSKKWQTPKTEFPVNWRVILLHNINFYNAISDEEKKRFEYKIQEFLLNCRITGIKTTVDIKDKLLVASSAIIPIFSFNEWRYTNLQEVLLYPSMFNQNFETEGNNTNILGMVGSGYMEGKMILSKPALINGFSNSSDKKNTAIHEFTHLIDKIDGVTDGIPAVLLDKQYVIPWLDLIKKEIDVIYSNKSDINPYGATNNQEFFAVISEYFFERPKLLKKKHPELYSLLEKIFQQKPSTYNLKKKNLHIGRNSPCPCNSGLKFKNCCGKIH